MHVLDGQHVPYAVIEFPSTIHDALGVAEHARQADCERTTGLKVGGISARALLHRGFDIYDDEPAMLLDELVVSAGQRGLNVRLGVGDLLAVTGARGMDAGRGGAASRQ